MFHPWAVNNYIKQFLKPEPGDPFANLLIDEDALSAFKLEKPKTALQQARKYLALAQEQLNFYINFKKELDPKYDPGLDHELQRVQWAITDARRIINQISKEGIPVLGEGALLQSSWLYGGMVRFSTQASTIQDEILSQVEGLLVKLIPSLNNPTLNPFLIRAAVFVRSALLLIPSKGIPKPGEKGTLNLSVLKRERPKKFYGPYAFPDVSYSTWRAMVQATGMNGTGAGTIFWREFLFNHRAMSRRQLA